MNPMSKKPENMTRVLLVGNDKVTVSFGFYKDGMYKEDGSYNWNLPDEYDGWFSISQVKQKLKIK